MDNDMETDHHYSRGGEIMLISAVVLFVFIIIMVCIHLQIRCYLLHARRRRRRRSHFFFYVDPSISTAATRGLDPSVISSLPVFTFSPNTHPDPVECAVCLSELEDGETGRVMPKCKHTFHVGCIDMWFHSHSTCPLCRVLVEPEPEMDTRLGVSDPEQSSSSAFCAECQQDGEEMNRSGPVVYSSSKPSSLLGVTVEVPGRDDSFRGESSSSFRSPMSRVLSLTRILSREKKASGSPSSGCEAGCSSELGSERGHESEVTRSAGV